MKRRPVAFAALAYALLTLAYTWPLVSRLSTGVAHDLGDPLLNAWILWWSTKAVPLTAHWWNALIFYPAPGTFAFSEHLLGLAPVSAPIIALTGNALLGYNVALLCSYVFCGLGAYFLAYTLTRRHDAAFVAGLAFAFAPYRLAQVPHIQVLCAYWTPVCLAALHRYDRDGTTGWAALAAGAWFMQAMSNGYYFFFLSVLLLPWLAWFAAGRWPLVRWVRLAACFAAAIVLLAPFLNGYRTILQETYGYHRNLEEIRQFSADAGGLLTASEDLLFWSWLRLVSRPEGELFAGVTVVALAAAAIVAARPLMSDRETATVRWIRRALGALAIVFLTGAMLAIYHGAWRLTVGGVRLLSIGRPDKPLTLALICVVGWLATLSHVAAAVRRRSPLTFYAFAAAAMWVFALGPDPTIMGKRLLYQAPYGWLMHLPGFDGLRVPARFWMMSVVCLGVLAASAVARARGRLRTALVVAASIGILADGWPRTFTVMAAPERRSAPPRAAIRLDLPMNDDTDAEAVFQQTYDPRPLYNGFSGYPAPHQYAMREMLAARDTRILTALAARGPLGVVIDHRRDEDGKIRQFVLACPGAALHETHAGWSSYLIPAAGSVDVPPDESGQPISIKSVDALPSPPHAPRAIDGDIRTRWSGGVQQSSAEFTIELAAPGRVHQVVTELGEYMTDYPVRLQLDVSSDGVQWETVYLADTVVLAYYAAVRHPRTVPIVYPIDRDHVRFIRMRQLGWGPHDWSIAELRVLR